MKKKCSKCNKEVYYLELSSRDECYECKKKRDDNDSSSYTSSMPGDMFNTGIPGGIDMDFSTPW